MPIMDGLQATAEIRKMEALGQLSHRNFIVAMTACASAEDEEQCFGVGMDKYMSKPVYPKIVKELVETQLSKKREMGQNTPPKNDFINAMQTINNYNSYRRGSSDNELLKQMLLQNQKKKL